MSDSTIRFDNRLQQPQSQDEYSASSGSDDPSISTLFGQLARNTQELIQQELTLAKTEISQAASKTGMAIAKMAMAAMLLFAGMLALLFAAIAGVHQADFSWWASAAIVGGVTLLVGLILVLIAKSQLSSVGFVPKQTIESLKEDQAAVKGVVR